MARKDRKAWKKHAEYLQSRLDREVLADFEELFYKAQEEAERYEDSNAELHRELAKARKARELLETKLAAKGDVVALAHENVVLRREVLAVQAQRDEVKKALVLTQQELSTQKQLITQLRDALRGGSNSVEATSRRPRTGTYHRVFFGRDNAIPSPVLTYPLALTSREEAALEDQLQQTDTIFWPGSAAPPSGKKN